MSTAKKAWKMAVDIFRSFYPFLLCWIGALFLIVSQDDSQIYRFIGCSLAGLSWMWALDLCAARSEAKAKSELASAIMGILVKGGDTQIDVVFSAINNTGTLTIKDGK